ncbi:MAG TPA: phosphatase PAP2 family protein [Candidatus Dormibacteraeota bacterium]|nr:phosphatase PAP2 family protein [Candidatus Dormibacteraeota bacterium]
MSAQPERAAKEVLAGEPQEAARAWLGPLVFAMFALFALDTYLVAAGALTRIFDVPITTFVQGVSWGPLVYPMELINASAGIWQELLGAVAIVVMFIVDRRAGWLMLIGSISSLLDNVIKLVISRHRPPADLVHILVPATGFSYPSGHAVFFTWLGFMVAASLAPRVKPSFRPLLWLGALILIALTCLARVWAGDHWPSDVLGGVMLGTGWSAFVLWLPERWLPSPSLKWFGGRLRRPGASGS